MEKLLNPTQIRERYLPGVSRSELYRLLETGNIAAFRLGRKWLIPESAIKTFIEVRLQPAFPCEQRDTRRGAFALHVPTSESSESGSAPRVIQGGKR
jgi:excisionase family DNA binding protein